MFTFPQRRDSQGRWGCGFPSARALQRVIAIHGKVPKHDTVSGCPSVADAAGHHGLSGPGSPLWSPDF